jgi:diguanylate cyclase (GGDEF)-like protein
MLPVGGGALHVAPHRGKMISLKKYLDSAPAPRLVLDAPFELVEQDILVAALTAYGSALTEMGSATLQACSGAGEELQDRFQQLKGGLSPEMGPEALAATSAEVQEQLRNWGRRATGHYQQKAGEVKELLLVMAHAAESVAARDQQCAGQIGEVTSRLKEIATLDDLIEIRASIEKSAVELKSSIERMTLESKAAIARLREQISSYQAKLEEAEENALRDALTGARSRLGVENQIDIRVAMGSPFCVAMLDIDDFKRVNDNYGHVTGDDLLRQFASELRSVCRSTDLIGRWGGDEFIIVFDCDEADADVQKDRVLNWVSGNYTVQGKSGPVKIVLDASIGLAEYRPGESIKKLLARADAAMYQHKADSRKHGAGVKN